MPAQRLVCFVFVNPQGLAGLRIQELLYWEVWGGQFALGKGGMENKNLWGSWRRWFKLLCHSVTCYMLIPAYISSFIPSTGS